MRFSCAIVCRNNERTIPRVLDSIGPVLRGLKDAGHDSEIVAYDSGSTDATLSILETAGARVLRGAWHGHIATKQMVLEACHGEWRLHLDSDESLEPDCAAALTRFLLAPGEFRAARLNRKVWYLDSWLNHVWQPEWRLRLVRGGDVAAGHARWGGLDPHDKLELIGSAANAPVEDLPGDVRHESFVDMADHLSKQIGHARTSAASLVATGARGSYLRLLISPPGAVFKQLVLRGGWRDGWRGWTASFSTGIATAMKHAILIELTHKGRDQ